jgi:acetyltransferase-like isoleucine patch superfamily enzyme
LSPAGSPASGMFGLARKVRSLPVTLGYVQGPRWMSRLRMAWVLLRNPHASISFGPGTYLGPGFSLHMPHGGTFRVGRGVEFRRNFRAELGGPTSLVEIGDNSVFTYDVIIQCDTTIAIGRHCTFGQNTILVDGNHRYKDPDLRLLEQGYDYRPLRIEDGATTMSKVTVINDIGERAVVGANAVVTRPVPPYSLAVGVPARVADYFGPPGGEVGSSSSLNSERSGPRG